MGREQTPNDGRSPSILRYLESVVYDGRSGVDASIVRRMLSSLAFLHRSVIKLYLAPFKWGIRKQHRLGVPVISVGNIAVGGTGKTPTVEYLCRELLSRRKSPSVLSYGYGGTLNGAFGVVSDKSQLLLNSRATGDEPAMLAAKLPGVPVVVGKHRHISGQTAIRDLGADVLILDDGFQVWKLHRDLDIVVLKADNPFDNRCVLPAGKLREPIESLQRADCAIITGETGSDALSSAVHETKRIAPGIAVFTGRFAPTGIRILAAGKELGIEYLSGKKVVALSSIANPGGFEDSLEQLGVNVVEKERFPDHHQYTPEDIRYIDHLVEDDFADIVVTTEKDAIKLDAGQLVVPIAVLKIELVLDDEPSFWEFVSTKIDSVGNPKSSKTA